MVTDNNDPASPPLEVVEALIKHCRCAPCCQTHPCDGVMAGGMCDEAECWCDGDCYADDSDDETDE